MAVLFISFAAALAIGTFIEDKYNTDTARILIYNAWWFEAIMAFFFINFLGNIKRYNLLRKEKLGTLILHLSFVLILIGAFITRYISYEGVMAIKEGQTEHQMFSDKFYLTVFVDGDHQGEMRRKTHEKPLILSQATHNNFSIKGRFSGTPYQIKYKDFIMGATENIIEDANGDLYLKLVESGDGNRHEHFLKDGEVQNIHNILFSFNKETEGAINIFSNQDDQYTIKSPFGGEYMVMATQAQGLVYADSLQDFNLRALYTMGGTSFVLPEPAMRGKIEYTSDGNWKDMNSDDALIVTVKSEGVEKDITLLGARGKMGIPISFTQGNLEYTLFFGSKVYDLPFSIHLKEFIAAKYPGTLSSFASFKSKIRVEDEEPFDYDIYMNHVLDHRGYRFFQASYNYSNSTLREAHEPDITVLSVNHDFWGTWTTYVGYTLLYISMIWILSEKNSRFGDIRRRLKKLKNKKAKMLSVFILLFGLNTFAQEYGQEHDHHHSEDSEHVHSEEHVARKPHLGFNQHEIDSLINLLAATKEHAEKFGKIVIQDAGGRMKPINTFSSELIRKVSKSDHYKGLNSDQVFLSMTQYPDLWFEVPLISLKRGNDSIRNLLGLDSKARYAPFINFFDEKGNYKLSPFLEEAYQAQTPNSFQKDFIEADKRVVLLNAALSGKILRVFPIPGDRNNKWISYLELNESGLTGADSMYVRNIIPLYFHSLQESKRTGGYKQTDELLESITAYQHKFGSEVMPSDKKIQSEITYNKYDIFKNLFSWYMYASALMFFFVILQIFYNNKAVNTVVKISHWIIGFLFLLHTAGLALRWYISGHAPWSDAYESMIYVAWATMLFGLIFGKKSPLTLASTTFVTSMILMIAHWSWMDPAIANLQPVLDSYWLMIHVSVIVGSYGPFAIGMVLGLVALFLMIFTTSKNKQKMELNIKELTYINEMALTVGLVMLTIGNFLGGQWANESWGRYWGWDPKETWALVSIMVYAFVIHVRLVPGLRGLWFFNLLSVCAIASIVMTYFGVNFYLSGLHSYASGDKAITPDFVYYSIAIIAVIGTFSYIKYKKFYKK